MPEPVVRKGEPTQVDASSFAELLDMAADGLFRLLLGRKSPKVLARAYHQPNNELSYLGTWFLQDGSEIAAMISGYAGAGHDEAKKATEKELLRGSLWRKLRAGLVAYRLRKVLDFIDDVPERAFYVQAVAVFPDHRGKGYSRMLMGEIEALARRQWSLALELDVDTTNSIAISAYESFGFETLKTSPEVHGIQVQRMVKRLDVEA